MSNAYIRNRNKILFETLMNSKFHKDKKNFILKEQDEAVPLPGDSNATAAATPQQEGEKTRGDYLVANGIMKLSNALFSSTGIRILDPSANKSPPKWARTPNGARAYAAFQGLADIFAEDPFTLALFLIPPSELVSPLTKSLRAVGISDNIIASLLRERSVGQVISKLKPEEIKKVIENLSSTDVKSVVSDFLKNLAQLNSEKTGQTILYSVPGPQIEQAGQVVKAARKTASKAAQGELRTISTTEAANLISKAMEEKGASFIEMNSHIMEKLAPLAERGQLSDSQLVGLAKQYFIDRGIALPAELEQRIPELLSSVSLELETIRTNPENIINMNILRSGKSTSQMKKEAVNKLKGSVINASTNLVAKTVESTGSTLGTASGYAVAAFLIYLLLSKLWKSFSGKESSIKGQPAESGRNT
jgi:hypothetical protein